MRVSHVPIRLWLMVGLCMVILGVGVCLRHVSAEVESPAGPVTADQGPARPVAGPPGPKPDFTVPGGPTPTPTVVTVSVPLPDPAVPQPVPISPPAAPISPPVAPPAPLRPLTCGPITDFEQFGTWKRGDEPYGTFTQVAGQAYSGSYSGQLSYSFPTAGNDYVVFRRTIPMGGAGAALTAWVYGDNSGHFLNAWVKDAGGEIWSFPFGQIKHTGWQQMTAPLDVLGAWPTNHVSGKPNGMLDYPASFYAFVLDDVPDISISSGVIYIDDLSCADMVYAPPAGSPQVPIGPSQPPVGPPQGAPSSGCVITLQEPAEGSEFGGGTETVTLRWLFNRALAPQEYFFVNVEFPHGGQTWFDGTWRDPGQQLPDGTRDTSWTLRDYLCGPGFSDTGWYKWNVTVRQQLWPEKSLSDNVVCRSDIRNFKWSGCAPTPEPPGNDEYDLYVRRMDFSPANPVAGQNIDMYVMIATDISPDGGPYFPASHFHWRPNANAGWNEESCPDNAQYATCVKTLTFSYSQAGNYDVKVEADSRDEVDETEESNNDKKWTLQVN